jgi:hypothetical protein
MQPGPAALRADDDNDYCNACFSFSSAVFVCKSTTGVPVLRGDDEYPFTPV